MKWEQIKGDVFKFGRGLGLHMFIVFFEDTIVQGFKQYLGQFDVEAIRAHVAAEMPLPMHPNAFSELKGLENELGKIEPGLIFEFLAKARPDLAEALEQMGDVGAEYIVALKQHIIENVRNAPSSPEPAPTSAVSAPSTKEAKAVSEEVTSPPAPAPISAPLKRCTCEDCGQSWEMTEESIAHLQACPFCGSPA